MPRSIEVYIRNLDRAVGVSGGTTLEEIFRDHCGSLALDPICARVNNKTEDLQYPVFSPKQVEFLDTTVPTAHRVYIRSLCMMLYKALTEVCPGARLRIEHSISRGCYCRVDGPCEVNETMRVALLAAMRRLVERDLPFRRHEQLTADVIEMFRVQGLYDKVDLLETMGQLYTVYYELDGLSDSYYGALAPSTGHIRVFDLLLYKEGLLLVGPSPDDVSVTASPVAQEKMYNAFTDYLKFNRIIGISNVGQLNRSVEDDRSAMLINVAEALHEKSISRISDDIKRRYDAGGARVVLIAGPSSSGKTTFTKRLAIQLMTNLLKPEMISLDNYFVNRDRTPLDEFGDYDYESLYALDLERFNADLNTLISGGEVELPYYNFELGERQFRGDRIRLGEGAILLIEGIHGLNPELTESVSADMKYRVYVSALTTLSIDDHNWVPTTDNRLLRRIIRDAKYRGVGALETIRRWPSVRRGEERWIFPYQENADSMFNSSLLFELGVIKDEAEGLLRKVPATAPEYAEAYRLRRFLDCFLPISDRRIPSTSLLREFLGGSSFHY